MDESFLFHEILLNVIVILVHYTDYNILVRIKLYCVAQYVILNGYFLPAEKHIVFCLQSETFFSQLLSSFVAIIFVSVLYSER